MLCLGVGSCAQIYFAPHLRFHLSLWPGAPLLWPVEDKSRLLTKQLCSNVIIIQDTGALWEFILTQTSRCTKGTQQWYVDTGYSSEKRWEHFHNVRLQREEETETCRWRKKNMPVYHLDTKELIIVIELLWSALRHDCKDYPLRSMRPGFSCICVHERTSEFELYCWHRKDKQRLIREREREGECKS